MPDFDYEVLNQWYEWIAKKKANAVDLVGKTALLRKFLSL